MIAGEGRFDTEVMRLFGPRVFVKTGAEGWSMRRLAGAGLGLAVKADDGATRAAQAMIATLISRFLPVDEEIAPAWSPSSRRASCNWNGIAVGSLRPAGPLARRATLVREGLMRQMTAMLDGRPYP